MSDDAELYDDDELDLDAAGERRAKSSAKKKLLFIILPVVLLIGAGAGLYFSGILGGGDQKEAAKAGKPAESPPEQTVYLELPPMVVNLDSTTAQQLYLKIQPSLEVADEQTRAALSKLSPILVDVFQVNLRELRIEDLRGGAGLKLLRRQLLSEIESAVHPIKVQNILFKNILIQ